MNHYSACVMGISLHSGLMFQTLPTLEGIPDCRERVSET